jgi:hypothetical protein
MDLKQKFHETTITIKILSDRPIHNLDLQEIIEESDSGDLVLSVKSRKSKNVSAKTTAKKLYEYGSEPGFFQLDDDGNEVV